MGLKQTPKFVVVFFKEKLEKELLRKELAFAKRKESEIQETRFKIVKIKDSYEPQVESQR